jgi:hypothetical protein
VYLKSCPVISRVTVKIHETPIRIADMPPEFQISNFPNTNPEIYFYSIAHRLPVCEVAMVLKTAGYRKFYLLPRVTDYLNCHHLLLITLILTTCF